MRAVDDRMDGVQHGAVALVVEGGEQRAVAVHAEHELGEVVRPDGHARHTEAHVLVQPTHHRRDLGHDPQFEVARPRQRACVDERAALAHLPTRAHEGQHEMQVLVLTPHVGERL